jgi:hypothetical protein
VLSGFEENLDKHMLGAFDYCLQTGILYLHSFNDLTTLATRKALEVYEKLVVRDYGISRPDR